MGLYLSMRQRSPGNAILAGLRTKSHQPLAIEFFTSDAMTTPCERTRALLWAGEFLAELLCEAKAPGVPEAIRNQAKYIIRHYPTSSEVDWIARQTERDSLFPMLESQGAGSADPNSS